VIGGETVLIDAGPDLESQLERESIRRIDRIFITHWHFDHIAGLGGLGELVDLGHWPPIDIYIPKQVARHFDEELAYAKTKLCIHPIEPGDVIEVPDASWEVVKTTHTDHSVGFIVRARRSFAYLVDGVVPPDATIRRLINLDLVILEASVDELDATGWVNFSLNQAVAFWRTLDVRRCILTHLSCHSWKDERLVSGLSESDRKVYEAKMAGLTFAHDGLSVEL
jgi:phosphoribosyl 1,2-cyclic phosphate phosphodiesterase